MKKILFTFLIAIVLLLTFCYLIFYSYKVSVLVELKQKDDHIKEIWSLLYKKSSDRLILMEKLPNVSGCDIFLINNRIIQNKSERNLNKIDELWNLEYATNKAYLTLEKCFVEKSSNNTQIDSLNSNAEQLNKLVDEYNANVKDFNKYYSTFPNFIFGSKKGFRREKFFYLKYGHDNEEYYNQKKKAEKWIETGKWE